MRPINKQCLAPPERYSNPTFPVPPMACDSHSHVTPSGEWKLAPDASYVPAAAPAAASRQMRKALRLERGVVVQASAFGTDNRGVFEALAADPDSVRGVVVADASIGDPEIERMHRLGVRGMRFITSGLGGTVGTEAMVALAPRIAPFGWHVEVLPSVEQWPDLLPVLEKLPSTIVIDHMGGIGAEIGTDHPSLRAVRRLVQERGAYVKLIGYRLASDPNDPRLIERARALFREAPEQMVWGTDWPHVALAPMPDAGALLNAFAGWFDNDRTAIETVLSRNPARLFDFPDAPEEAATPI